MTVPGIAMGENANMSNKLLPGKRVRRTTQAMAAERITPIAAAEQPTMRLLMKAS